MGQHDSLDLFRIGIIDWTDHDWAYGAQRHDGNRLGVVDGLRIIGVPSQCFLGVLVVVQETTLVASLIARFGRPIILHKLAHQADHWVVGLRLIGPNAHARAISIARIFGISPILFARVRYGQPRKLLAQNFVNVISFVLAQNIVKIVYDFKGNKIGHVSHFIMKMALSKRKLTRLYARDKLKFLSMKIAIITPYYKEAPEILQRCIQSVKDQSIGVEHILVADGHALPNDSLNVKHHIILPQSNNDYGDTPRMIGSVFAYSQGYDAIAWLDADNWFEPDHIEEMLNLVNLNPMAEVITATRNLRRPDGSLLAVDDESNGQNFNDTNCYLILRSAMHLANLWSYKSKTQAIVGDRRVWDAAKKLVTDHCTKPTVNYTTMFGLHYMSRGEQPPEGAKVIISLDGGENYTMWTFDQYMEHVKKLQK